MSKKIKKKLKRLRSIEIKNTSPLFKKVRVRKVKPKKVVKKKKKSNYA